MNFSDVWRALGRAWAFGRHIPPGKILRRAALRVRRAALSRMGAPPDAPPPPMAAQPPLPIFPARTGALTLDGDAHAFTFLGRTEIMRGRVDWRAPGPAGNLQLWRMNLHAMEWLEGVDDATLKASVADWIAANPVTAPNAWSDAWSAYTLSIRVVVWMQQIARRAMPPRDDALTSLAAQIRFLERNLETDLGGNHLVKNIKALLWASAFFDGPEAARWRRLGLSLLAAALKEQVLPDGMHFERSPSYHGQVFADFLECRAALGVQGAPHALDEALARMAGVVADLSHPDRRVAEFNDSGLSMAYAPAVCLDAFAAQFGAKPAQRDEIALPDAGYFGLRTQDTYFIADCGRIGPDDLPAHAHGDVLSFEWSVGGRRVVVDPGVFEYYQGARRQASRSAASHNTLCFAGADQADFFGAFRVGRRPNVEVRNLAFSPGMLTLEGSHDGFRILPGAPRPVRRFEASGQGLKITDRIEGKPDRPATIGFLLHPDVAVTADGAALRLTLGDRSIRVESGAPMAVHEAVWWPDMGAQIRTKRILVSVEPGSREVITTFAIEPTGPQRAQKPT